MTDIVHDTLPPVDQNINLIAAFLSSRNSDQAGPELAELHPADFADQFEQLSLEQRL